MNQLLSQGKEKSSIFPFVWNSPWKLSIVALRIALPEKLKVC